MKKKELDNTLDKIAAGIRAEQIDDGVVNDASGRVWSRINDATRMFAEHPQDASAPMADRIAGCADFQSLIPAYLGNRLSEARSLLLVDHTHECIPCRKALKQARSRNQIVPEKAAVRTQGYRIRPVVV